jgi:hypothetical protein
MITRNRIELSEKQASIIWRQAFGAEFISTENELLNVIYPGRVNGDNGPDFRDAVVLNRLRLTKGDIEVHVRSSDWYNHEHHTDAAYNNVILHVAMWHDRDSVTLLQNGKPVPLICLAEALRHQAYLLPCTLPCFRILDHMDVQNTGKILNTAGEERFRQKAMHFQDQVLGPTLTALSVEEPASQVFYRGMMRALGYAKNTKPFEDLADRTPLNLIEFKEGLAAKQAMLLGTAGLLPSQRWQGESVSGEEIQVLEQIWQSARGEVKSMREGDWNLSHIYPNNSPVRRIIALSYLLDHYRKERLLPGMMRLVKEAPLPGGHRLLEDSLTVAGEGYWRAHFDFHVRSKTTMSALLGNSKAREIIVNVVLPFACSWGQLAHDASLAVNALELYLNHPKLAENFVTRHMAKQLGLDDLSGFTVCHQQGLVHIFCNYCREGRCTECPLVR